MRSRDNYNFRGITGLTASETKILLVLSDWEHEKDSATSWNIAKKAGLSQSAVTLALRKLRELKVVFRSLSGVYVLEDRRSMYDKQKAENDSKVLEVPSEAGIHASKT